jgi:hypothetical protein
MHRFLPIGLSQQPQSGATPQIKRRFFLPLLWPEVMLQYLANFPDRPLFDMDTLARCTYPDTRLNKCGFFVINEREPTIRVKEKIETPDFFEVMERE